MRPADVKSSTYINLGKENNKRYPKFKVGNHVRILKHGTCLKNVTLQVGLRKFL